MRRKIAVVFAVSGWGISIMKLLRLLVTDDLAQDLAEYGIALATIALGACLAAIAVAGNVNAIWSTANTSSWCPTGGGAGCRVPASRRGGVDLGWARWAR